MPHPTGTNQTCTLSSPVKARETGELSMKQIKQAKKDTRLISTSRSPADQEKLAVLKKTGSEDIDETFPLVWRKKYN